MFPLINHNSHNVIIEYQYDLTWRDFLKFRPKKKQLQTQICCKAQNHNRRILVSKPFVIKKSTQNVILFWIILFNCYCLTHNKEHMLYTDQCAHSLKLIGKLKNIKTSDKPELLRNRPSLTGTLKKGIHVQMNLLWLMLIDRPKWLHRTGLMLSQGVVTLVGLQWQ